MALLLWPLPVICNILRPIITLSTILPDINKFALSLRTWLYISKKR